MMLSSLLDGLDARLVGDGAVEVRAVRGDSRAIGPGDVFVAVRGRRVDGHAFVPQAVAQGAAAVVVERALDGLAVPQVVVPDCGRALGPLVARALGDPASRLTLVGITGTNGKTTSSYLAEAMLASAARRVGVLGTVNYRWGGQVHDAPYTTPTPETLHGAFAGMVEAACTHAVMEVTSSALAFDRTVGLRFAVAAFSNFTQDHLDVHGTMEAYLEAKLRLFRDHLAPDGVAVVNVDDPHGEAAVRAAAGHRVLRVSLRADADAEVRVVEADSSVAGIRARIATPRGELTIASRPLIGAYNVANLALVVGIGEALGLPHAELAAGLAALPGVPGRVERVANDAGLDLFVDYAHTPDALRNVLTALRPLTRRRLICVFGCGGDRDPTKRPLMGAAVAELADLAVVTSDNPRTEDPRAILDMILPAVPAPFCVDPDRRAAIRAAVAEAVPGDIVLIAGKGHEDYQVLGTTKVHFDDREEAAAAAALRPSLTAEAAAAAAGGAVVRGDGAGAAAVAPAPSVARVARVVRVVIDGRAAAPGDLYVAIRGERFDGHDYCGQAVAAGATAVMVERSRAPALAAALPAATTVIAVDDPRAALGRLARAHRDAWGAGDPARRLVAITGSSGKTTTKDLARAALGHVAATLAPAGSLNNETGVPLTVLGLRAHHRFGVVEMGMRGAGQIAYLVEIAAPDVAVVVNAGTAHIELLGSTEAIADAKAEIWTGAPRVVVAPADDPRLTARARRLAPGATMLTFGEAAGADVRLAGYRATGPDGAALVLEALGARHELALPLVGRHNAVDACAALAAALGAGAPVDAALAGLARARLSRMRSEVVELAGRHVIVDCYNANPGSMAAALRTLAELASPAEAGRGRGLAVLGDMLELGDHAAAAHREAGGLAAALGLGVVALGDWAEAVCAAAGGDAAAVREPAEAARLALARTAPGDWILVKASRGMRLERVVAAMQEAAS